MPKSRTEPQAADPAAETRAEEEIARRIGSSEPSALAREIRKGSARR